MGKGKKGSKRKQETKREGRAKCDAPLPPGIPVLQRLKQRDSRLTWATQNSSSVKNGGGGNH